MAIWGTTHLGGCGGVSKKREIRFGGGHGPNNAHYFVLLFSGGVRNFYLYERNLSNGKDSPLR